MKQNDPKNPKKKTFLRIPTFPGGKEAYQQFIKDNVAYPEQALSNQVEGTVYLVYTVNNIGEILDVEVTKGIGFGCDEEAIRVIRLMKYEPARNRGVKMKVDMKTKFNFKLPENELPVKQSEFQLNYSSTTSEKQNSPEPKSQAVYNYTINLQD
jgi:TonB family protein